MSNWFSEHKSISVGGGLALLTALAQIFSEKVKQHPILVYIVLVVGLLMVIVPLIVSLFGDQEKREAAKIEHQVGGSNLGEFSSGTSVRHSSGTQLVAGRDLIYTPPQSPRFVAEKLPAAPKKLANLVALGFTMKDDKHCYMSDNGRCSLVVIPIENRLPTISADSVCISLRFTGSHGLHQFVERAFWYGKPGHEITIPVSTMAFVVLGGYADHRWHYFENNQQFPRDFRFDGDHYEEPEERKYLNLIGGPINVELIIFNRHKADEYLRKHYTLKENDERTAIEIIDIQ